MCPLNIRAKKKDIHDALDITLRPMTLTDTHGTMDTLGFEPRAFRMQSGCDATTPCALMLYVQARGWVRLMGLEMMHVVSGQC